MSIPSTDHGDFPSSQRQNELQIAAPQHQHAQHPDAHLFGQISQSPEGSQMYLASPNPAVVVSAAQPVESIRKQMSILTHLQVFFGSVGMVLQIVAVFLPNWFEINGKQEGLWNKVHYQCDRTNPSSPTRTFEPRGLGAMMLLFTLGAAVCILISFRTFRLLRNPDRARPIYMSSFLVSVSGAISIAVVFFIFTITDRRQLFHCSDDTSLFELKYGAALVVYWVGVGFLVISAFFNGLLLLYFRRNFRSNLPGQALVVMVPNGQGGYVPASQQIIVYGVAPQPSAQYVLQAPPGYPNQEPPRYFDQPPPQYDPNAAGRLVSQPARVSEYAALQ